MVMRSVNVPSRAVLAAIALAIALLSTVLSSSASANRTDLVGPVETTTAAFSRGSLAVDSTGRAALAYFNLDDRSVRFVRCGSKLGCSPQELSESVLATLSRGSAWVSMKLDSNDNPVISYNDDGLSKVIVCADPGCATWTDETLDAKADFANTTFVAVGPNDLPSVLYTMPDFRTGYVACTTATCSSHTDPVVFGSEPSRTTSDIEFGPDGLPWIAYSDNVNGQQQLQLAKCATVACEGSPAALATGPATSWPQIEFGESDVLVGGRAYADIDDASRSVWVLTCERLNCDSVLEVKSRTDFPQGLGDPVADYNIRDLDMAWSEDTGAVFAFIDDSWFPGELNVHTLPNASDQTTNTVVTDGDTIRYPDIEFHDGNAMVAYHVLGEGWSIVQCDYESCMPTCNGQEVTVDLAGGPVVRQPGPTDVVRGTAGDDQILDGRVICGQGGDDTIQTSVLNAQVFGAAGNDTIQLGRKGFASGGPGNDEITGSPGLDRIFGGPGNDVLIGRGGTDRLAGGDGNDRIEGGGGNDTLLGNLGRDNISGGAGNDVIKGGAWIDRVDGGAGSDDRCGIVAGEVRINCERGIFGL